MEVMEGRFAERLHQLTTALQEGDQAVSEKVMLLSGYSRSELDGTTNYVSYDRFMSDSFSKGGDYSPLPPELDI
ncbi:hypothetical protein [Herpetosiphon giganteus]|uniref:hypothetical protein n=1 Tax=Herpetosiphon giganteus TaxID=2029754 RepID=UPI00195961DE|nr:hypothetical protein [Herpetosiphon giganteus]MBM7846652.1 hypothetical protein [Herpetosiphon giganteus]